MIRRGLGAAGVLAMGYAVVGALTDPDARRPGHLLVLAAVLVGHDLILLPAALGVGALVGRRLPSTVRGPVLVGLFVSAVVVVVALPVVLGYGRPADDPSVLPREYGRGLALALAAAWLGVAAAVLYRRATGKRVKAEDSPCQGTENLPP